MVVNEMDFTPGIVALILLVGLADWFTIYKVSILADIVLDCLVWWKCEPYNIYPWSKHPIHSRSSPWWLLLHVIVGLAQLNVSAFRIWSFVYQLEKKGIKTVAGWVRAVFYGVILINFWRFGNFGFMLGSVTNLLPLAAVYCTSCDFNDVRGDTLTMRWLHFLATWIAPGFEIVQYVIR